MQEHSATEKYCYGDCALQTNYKEIGRSKWLLSGNLVSQMHTHCTQRVQLLLINQIAHTGISSKYGDVIPTPSTQNIFQHQGSHNLRRMKFLLHLNKVRKVYKFSIGGSLLNIHQFIAIFPTEHESLDHLVVWSC